MTDIFHPLTLSRGSHKAGSGRGCAMNVISWENGDITITDYPSCSDRMLSGIVQNVNDVLADGNGFLSPTNSLIVLELGHATVGTTDHSLSVMELKRVYVRCAIFAARKVVHLAKTPAAEFAILAAQAWVDNPTQANQSAAAAAAYAAYADAARAAAAADAAAADADAAYAYVDAYADAYAAYAAADAAYAAAAADAAYAAAAARDAAAAVAADAAARAAADADAYAAYAAAAADAADADASYADAADAAAAEFRIELAREIITLFKELTGTTSSAPNPKVVACAIEKMLVNA